MRIGLSLFLIAISAIVRGEVDRSDARSAPDAAHGATALPSPDPR